MITELSQIRGHNMKAIMVHKKWNYQTMGTASHLSPQTIGNCIKGKQNVSKKVVRALVLNVQVVESWLDSDNRKNRNPVPHYTSRVVDELEEVSSVVPKVNIRLWSDTMDLTMEVSKDKAIGFLTAMINDQL